MSLSLDERVLCARIAVHTSWASTADPAARTRAGRESFLERFEQQVDPDGVLEPAERARRADNARKAYFAQLAFRSSRARAAKREAR